MSGSGRVEVGLKSGCRMIRHTDRLLDESSYNPTSHKVTTVRTLTRRAQLVCDTPDSLRDENKYLERVFMKNNYNADFIRRNIYRPTNADATDQNLTHATTVRGTSETISRILQPYNIRVAHKPTTTLRHLLTNVKDRDEPNNNLVPRVSHLTAWGERGETLAHAGHVSPRIWEVTIYSMKGGAA